MLLSKRHRKKDIAKLCSTDLADYFSTQGWSPRLHIDAAEPSSVLQAPCSLNHEPIFEGGAQPLTPCGDQSIKSICLAAISATRANAIGWTCSGKPLIRLRECQQQLLCAESNCREHVYLQAKWDSECAMPKVQAFDICKPTADCLVDQERLLLNSGGSLSRHGSSGANLFAIVDK